MRITHHDVIESKNGEVSVLRWVLKYADTSLICRALDIKMKQSRDFISNEPIVLDALKLSEAPDWFKIKESMQQHKLVLLGVCANSSMHAGIRQAGLHVIDLDRRNLGIEREEPRRTVDTPRPVAPTPAPAAAPPQPNKPDVLSRPIHATTPIGEVTASKGNLFINRHLRSGQTVYAENGDVVVFGNVSAGAVVRADGNIHIYGALRGRAEAGVTGNVDARIFCSAINEAEIVVIAGIYRTIDEQSLDEEVKDTPVMVSLVNKTLKIQKIEF